MRKTGHVIENSPHNVQAIELSGLTGPIRNASIRSSLLPSLGEYLRYKFVAAYCVHGITMNSADDVTTIYQDNGMHVFLSADITSALAVVDRQHAIGAVMLGLSVGHTSPHAPSEAWKAHVQKTVKERHSKYKTSAFVVIEVCGDIPVTLPGDLQVHEHDGYGICFDAYDKNALAEVSQLHVANALSSVRLAAQTACQFELVTRGSFLIAEAGQIIHSMSFSLNGSATLSQRLDVGQIETMRSLFVNLKSAPELMQPLDLHAQSLNHQETRLRAFMAAWNALEHFTFAVKNKYGSLWEAERGDATTSPARVLTLNSIPNAAGELAKAFGKMACMLGGADAVLDIAELLALKKIRNALSHELNDKELPVESVQVLMDKYLKKHLTIT